VEDCHARASFRVEHVMKIPACADEALQEAIRTMYPREDRRINRSGELVEMKVSATFSLSRSGKQVEIRVEGENNAKDHRLRILFDCGVNTDEVESAGHFGKDTRPVAKDGKFWPEMQTLPMGYFVKRDDLGVVHNAFCEYEGINNAEGTLAVTVMRCVKNIICTEFRSAGKFLHEDGGQSLGRHEYEYALTFGDACPFMTAERFNAPIKAVQIGKGEGTELPLEKSFLEVTGGVVTSAVKKAEDSDATVVRVFNPSDEEKTINLRGTEVNLNEEEIGAFDGKVGAWKIVSVKI
jgi:mannosylglycerate hydrolase